MDKREPLVNANCKFCASPEYSTDELPILDPVTNTVTSFHAPVRDTTMLLSLGDGHAGTLSRRCRRPIGPIGRSGTRVNNHRTRLVGQLSEFVEHLRNQRLTAWILCLGRDSK
jgi:hypothetical protein